MYLSGSSRGAIVPTVKRILAASALLVFGYIASLQSQDRVKTQELPNVLPADARVDQFTLTSEGQRAYYTTPAGDIWLYDRSSRTNSRVATGSFWDVSVSPLRDALVYTGSGETRQEQYVWLLPLDQKTGLASGTARRVSEHTGDVPSISPDGRWIAFARDDSTGVGQSVVVVPIGGGQERVVAGVLPSSIGSIRWTPDGKTLYFGVNPPVPFTCAESCLSIPGGNPQVPGTIRRVSVDGGPVAVVATTGNPSPGLSPDGTKLVFGDVKVARQFVIADTTGRTVDTFTLPANQTQLGWLNNSTLLNFASGTVRRLRAVSLTGGSSRVLFETGGVMSGAAVSPDGKIASVLRAVDGRCELRNMDAVDGTVRQAIALPDAGCGESLTWTTDQRQLLYTQYSQPAPRPVITAVDVGTGQTRPLRDARPADMTWVIDANAVIVSELSAASGPQRRVSFSQVELDGNATLLRELPFDEPPGSFAGPIDRSTAFMMSAGSHEFRLVPLDGSADRRVALTTQNGSVFPRPSISGDRRWAAFRITPSGNDPTRMSIVELVRLDGTERRVIDLPFIAQSVFIMPGAQDLMVVERPSPGTDLGVYVVNVATRSAKKLFVYATQGRLPEFVASSDGRTVLGLMTETRAPAVAAMDLAGIK
jgi:Tol biopolymer transport system component